MRAALRSRSIRTFLATQFLLEVQFWFPIWLIYLIDLGFSLTTAVLADAVFRIVSVLCEFPVGMAADLLGRRRTYLALAGGSVLTFALISQIRSVQMLFAAWVLWGVLWALTSGAASTYLYELCSRDHRPVDPSKAFGLMRAAGSVSVLLSLLAAGYVYEADPRLPFAVTAALAAAAFLLALTLPETAGPRPVGRLSSMWGGVRGALADSRVRRAVWLGVLLLLFGWSARILFQPLALELNLSAEVTGWMYAAFAAAAVLGGLAAGHVGVRRRRAGLALAFLLVLGALVALSQAPRLGPFVFLPVMGFGYALGTTLLEVLTNEVSPRPVRAMIFGVVACLAGLGIALARPALGVLATDHSTAFAAGVWSGCGAVVVALALWLARGLPRAPEGGASPAGPIVPSSRTPGMPASRRARRR
ncbi:MFS transporter [Micromonospora krabiensis]|uniref:Predicted arabinose efflux permease, MFS family n=1 Tax=Micromonospora krabiensis TaxID=307121 RepID=A0A1C3N1W7_9ACTN|nr:MFS transporter [Micromonospora krabiensis]SBV26569.1 Predicted arabinose efflux permease, MFS family [Micromonospora krabiensis]